MAQFAVIYRYSTDATGLDEHRPAHKAYLGSLFDDGHILVSGPLGEGGRPAALLIMQAETSADVAALLDKDPFHQEGLIVEREIRPWTVVYGSLS